MNADPGEAPLVRGRVGEALCEHEADGSVGKVSGGRIFLYWSFAMHTIYSTAHVFGFGTYPDYLADVSMVLVAGGILWVMIRKFGRSTLEAAIAAFGSIAGSIRSPGATMMSSFSQSSTVAPVDTSGPPGSQKVP